MLIKLQLLVQVQLQMEVYNFVGVSTGTILRYTPEEKQLKDLIE